MRTILGEDGSLDSGFANDRDPTLPAKAAQAKWPASRKPTENVEPQGFVALFYRELVAQQGIVGAGLSVRRGQAPSVDWLDRLILQR